MCAHLKLKNGSEVHYTLSGGEIKASDQTFKGKQESDVGRKERGLSLAGEGEKAWMQVLGTV